MPYDPDTRSGDGVLRNKLDLATAAGLEAAEREITHAALILLRDNPQGAGSIQDYAPELVGATT